MEFSTQEYWSGLPCPPPGNLPDPGVEPRSPALQVDSSPSEPSGRPLFPSGGGVKGETFPRPLLKTREGSRCVHIQLRLLLSSRVGWWGSLRAPQHSLDAGWCPEGNLWVSCGSGCSLGSTFPADEKSGPFSTTESLRMGCSEWPWLTLGSCRYSFIAVPESGQLTEDTSQRHAPSLLI